MPLRRPSLPLSVSQRTEKVSANPPRKGRDACDKLEEIGFLRLNPRARKGRDTGPFINGRVGDV